MKRILFLFVVFSTIASGCCEKKNTTVVTGCAKIIDAAESFRTMETTDSTIIASLETDSCIYDPELVLNPIDDSILKKIISESGAIDTLSVNIPNRIVVKYKMQKSYIIVSEYNNTDVSIVSFLFSDNNLFLSNGIGIDDTREEIKELYKRNVLSGDVISILEESEMAEIKLFFKDEAIIKMMYMDYESCYELGLI